MKTTELLLSKEDFKGLKMNSEQSSLDILAQVCSVARDKLIRLKQTQPQPQPQPAKALKLKNIKIEPNSLSTHAAQDQETHYLNLRRRKTSSKTSRYDDDEDDDDDDDDDWELINVDQPKNKKKNKAKMNCTAKKGKKRPNHHHDHDIDGPDAVVPDLPEIFRRRIDEMQGTEIRMVIQKELTKTDLSSNHNRLSMPFSKITGWGFLREDEEANLVAQEKITVPLIEPEPVMNVTEVTLRQWIMRKTSGKSSSTYVLRTAWQEIVERNGLVPGQLVQVWSFRVEDRLHMALVAVQHLHAAAQLGLMLLPSTSHGGAAGSSGTSGGGNSAPEVAAA